MRAHRQRWLAPHSQLTARPPPLAAHSQVPGFEDDSYNVGARFSPASSFKGSPSQSSPDSPRTESPTGERASTAPGAQSGLQHRPGASALYGKNGVGGAAGRVAKPSTNAGPGVPEDFRATIRQNGDGGRSHEWRQRFMRFLPKATGHSSARTISPYADDASGPPSGEESGRESPLTASRSTPVAADDSPAGFATPYNPLTSSVVPTGAAAGWGRGERRGGSEEEQGRPPPVPSRIRPVLGGAVGAPSPTPPAGALADANGVPLAMGALMRDPRPDATANGRAPTSPVPGSVPGSNSGGSRADSPQWRAGPPAHSDSDEEGGEGSSEGSRRDVLEGFLAKSSRKIEDDAMAERSPLPKSAQRWKKRA